MRVGCGGEFRVPRWLGGSKHDAWARGARASPGSLDRTVVGEDVLDLPGYCRASSGIFRPLGFAPMLAA